MDTSLNMLPNPIWRPRPTLRYGTSLSRPRPSSSRRMRNSRDGRRLARPGRRLSGYDFECAPACHVNGGFRRHRSGPSRRNWVETSPAVMDEEHLMAAARFVETNAVRRGYMHSPAADRPQLGGWSHHYYRMSHASGDRHQRKLRLHRLLAATQTTQANSAAYVTRGREVRIDRTAAAVPVDRFADPRDDGEVGGPSLRRAKRRGNRRIRQSPARISTSLNRSQ